MSYRVWYITYSATRIRITVSYLSETMKARQKWSEILTMLKEKKPALKIQYAVKLFPISEGETTSHTKTEEFITSINIQRGL